MCVYIYIYIYIHIYIQSPAFAQLAATIAFAGPLGLGLDLYRILSRPTLYGAWLTKGGSGRGVVYCAMVVQYIAIE